jgi:hypothetical protein
MPFSTACSTTLSNFEAGLNYKDVPDPALMVSFPVLDDPDSAKLVAWTTTPWTLPSNLALCVHPEFDYVKVRSAKTQEVYIVAESRLAFMPGAAPKKKMSGKGVLCTALVPLAFGRSSGIAFSSFQPHIHAICLMPWTLPNNLALCVHPEFKYIVVSAKTQEGYISAGSRLAFMPGAASNKKSGREYCLLCPQVMSHLTKLSMPGLFHGPGFKVMLCRESCGLSSQGSSASSVRRGQTSLSPAACVQGHRQKRRRKRGWPA